MDNMIENISIEVLPEREEKKRPSASYFFQILKELHIAADKENRRLKGSFRWSYSIPLDVTINKEVVLKPEMFGEQKKVGT